MRFWHIGFVFGTSLWIGASLSMGCAPVLGIEEVAPIEPDGHTDGGGEEVDASTPDLPDGASPGTDTGASKEDASQPDVSQPNVADGSDGDAPSEKGDVEIDRGTDAGALPDVSSDPPTRDADDASAEKPGDSGAERAPDSDVLNIDAAAVAPPRLVAPLTGAAVTSRRPTLRWALAPDTDGVYLELCRDRLCSDVIAAFDAPGTSAAPSAALPAGLVFWRTYGRHGTVRGRNPSLTWSISVGAGNSTIDTSSGTIADVNGDGHADLIVGAYAAAARGRVYAYLGSLALDPLSSSSPTVLVGDDVDDGYFGNAVASAGDVNGDGYSDVVVGAPNVGADTGRAYVYLGSRFGLSPVPAVTLVGPDGVRGRFGMSAAGAGDINGDGYADILVGAANDGFLGRVYVYHGGPSGPSTTPSLKLVGADVLFGLSVAGAGDVNGDGYADVTVGAPSFSSSTIPGAGEARLYLGSKSGLSPTPAATVLPAPGREAFFGYCANGAGDFDGDGYSDVLVGTDPTPTEQVEQVYLYRGGPLGLSSTTPALTLTSPDPVRVGFGRDAASAGDLNGDGFADFVVGASHANGERGRIYVYFGGPSGSPPRMPVTVEAPDEVYGFGSWVAGIGDVNRDGYADFAIGAPISHQLFLYMGSPSGFSTTPAQMLRGPDMGGFGAAIGRAF